MIFGIGTDLLNISAIVPSVADLDDPFIRKIYTRKELEFIQSRDFPIYSFATRFAGKEAVFKCYGTNGNSLRLNEIEILENEVGQPVVFLHDKATELAKILGITKILISLSYDTDYAVAYVTAIGYKAE